MVFKVFSRKRKGGLNIFAPINGEIVQLSDVPDEVFNQKMMGEGIAITPKEGKVYAPVDGKVIQIAKTKHAIGFLTANQTEILIHIGLDTVHLKGEGFTMHAEEGQEVKMGDLLVEFDIDYVKANAKSVVTPIVIPNSINSEKEYIVAKGSAAKQGETILITVAP